MLVILRENVANLGRIGDVVDVTDGYARNFLLPRKLVAAADERNLLAVEHQKRLLEKKRQAQRAVAQESAKQLTDYVCVIKRKVGEHDKLFGSVTNHDIAEVMKAAGFSVERRDIELEAHIKTLGTHEVTVKFDSDVSTAIKVQVIKED